MNHMTFICSLLLLFIGIPSDAQNFESPDVNSQSFDCNIGPEQCGTIRMFTFEGITQRCINVARYVAIEPLCWQYHSVRQSCLCVCAYLRRCRNPDEQGEKNQPPRQEVGTTNTGKAGANDCFSADGVIETDKGPMTMLELSRVPQGSVRVKTIGQGNEVYWSEIRIWLHREENVTRDFVELATDRGNVLAMSPAHLIYTVPCEKNSKKMEQKKIARNFAKMSKEKLSITTNSGRDVDNPGRRTVKFASKLQIGDCVLVENGAESGTYEPSRIEYLQVTQKRGLYTFTTETGSVVVNGVAASSYSLFPHQTLAHSFFTGLYYLQKFTPAWMLGHDRDTLHPLVRPVMDSIAVC